MKKIAILGLAGIGVVLLLLAQCGGSDSSGGGSQSDETTPQGVLVDPYIDGAILYEDVNGDGVQDATEQLSSTTDASGAFTFSNALTSGSTIRMTSTKGTHNGVAFTGDLTAKPSSTTESIVVSPLTTLLTNGWTAAQIVGVLTDAGLTGLAEADLTTDPMAAFNLSDTSTSITDEKLTKLRATITIYNFLKIIDNLIRGNTLSDMGANGFVLTYDLFIQHPDVPDLLANMVTQIKLGLAQSVLDTLNDAMVQFKAACQAAADITIEDIIRGSVSISDYVIGQVVASCGADTNGDGFPNCDYSPNPTVFATWAQNLGKSYYTIRTKDNTCTQTGVGMSLLPDVMSKTTCEVGAETGAASDITCQ